MKNLCKVIAMTLVVFMVSTNSVAAFAEVKTENNKIQDFIEPEYLNMDSMKLDALIEQNLENDVALNNLLRAKAYKEDKFVDEEYYNLLSEKANNSREDFDKFIAYIIPIMAKLMYLITNR